MILYHGSVLIIENPDVSYSKSYLDFCKGFYTTMNKLQAEKWAKRRAMRNKGTPIVNVYNFSDNLSNYSVLSFDKEDEKWLDFVCRCRDGSNIYEQYDMVIGSVANDDVFKTVDMFLKGLWDKTKALEEIRYYKMTNQLCLINQRLIDYELKFDYAYKVVK
jgi:hypothetical protein